MSIDQAKHEAAAAELLWVVAELQRRIANDTLQGSEMILACRHILDAWVANGRASLDDEVVSFLGIESRSDHVLGGSQLRVGCDIDHVRFEPGSDAEKAEVHELGRFFKGSFERAVGDLAEHLATANRL